MADIGPPLDLGDDVSIDLDTAPSEEESKELDENAKKIEELDLFEEEEKIKNEENSKEENINNIRTITTSTAVSVTTSTVTTTNTTTNETINQKDTKTKTPESGNLQMTTIALDNSIDDDPLISSTSSSLQPLQLPGPSELENEVNRLSLDQPVPAAESPLDIKESIDNFWIDIAISEPRKVDEGVNAYIVYKICTQTNLPSFHQHKVNVHRRFSDFLGLHSRLVEKYAREGRIIPQAPEKSIIGMAKVKVSKNDTTSSSEFLEHRRAQLERFLHHLSVNPIFRSDPIFVDFLETEGDLERANHTSTLSGMNVKRLFSKVGDGLSRVVVRVEETDPWYENRNEVLYQNEVALKSLQNSVESVIAHRKDCASAMDLLSQDLSTLTTAEDDLPTSKALIHLAEVWSDLRDSHDVQANDDTVSLLAFVKDSLSMLHSSKDAMVERLKVWKSWKESEATLTRKREQLMKLQLHAKTDKNMPGEIAHFETMVEKYQEDFERVSANLKQESQRLDRLRKSEFKETLISSLESALANQQRTLKLWELFLDNTKKGVNA